MKHRILYVLPSFGIGGTCRALQNTLNLFDTNKFEIDVFVIVQDGSYNYPLQHCNVLSSDPFLNIICPSYYTLRGYKKVLGYAAKILNKISGGRLLSCLMHRTVNRIVKNGNYDALVAYSEGLPAQFVAEANHPNKIAWIHCDYENYIRLIGKSEYHIYNRIDKIICVSDFTRRAFLKVYPDFSSKTSYIYNVVDVDFIKNSSIQSDFSIYDKETINIVSVGRIDAVKRFSSIPEIAKKMSSNKRFKWYIIGPAVGNHEEYNKLLDNIEKCKVQDKIILLGEKTNPYPYIANADILACTSLSEACPYVLNEAKILHIPIVSTNFGSSAEFIDNNVNGIITPLENFHKALDSLMSNSDLYDKIKTNLLGFKYNNVSIMDSIYLLLNKRK